MLINILQDPCLQGTGVTLVIDALDECETNLDQLLHLIVQISSSSHAKLIVSSRNWPDIEDAFADATQKIRLSLELNQHSISAAVSRYIQYKVNQLVRWKNYDEKTRDTVLHHLLSNANDTFLWVALVCQELADPKAQRWHTRAKLHSFPPGLDSFYARMTDHVFNSNSVDADLCRQVIGRVSVVYRPLSLTELMSLIEPPEDFPNDFESLQTIIGLCRSLLTLREGFIYFVHHSAKNFLVKNESARIYPNGIAEENRIIVAKSLQVMSRTLRRDIYNLRAPGFSINSVNTPNPDPLAPAQYSCVYWVHHLADGNSVAQGQCSQDLQDGGPVHLFITNHFLHLLEALSLLKSVSEGVLQITKLAYLAQTSVPASKLTKLAQDGLRFIRTHRASIESSPLQTYASALIFSPTRSIIRDLFRREEPVWIVTKPIMEDEWNTCLQTLEGHFGEVTSVAFSGNSTQLASASTGQCLQTLEGHSRGINSVAFSADGVQLVSASNDNTVKIWDNITGQCLQTLRGHNDFVNSVTFSADMLQLASASNDGSVKIWNSATGQCLQTLEGHSNSVRSAAFSADGTQLASASNDDTVKIWDSVTGQCLHTLRGHSNSVRSVAFSADRIQLASASNDNTIKVWDSVTGQCLQTLRGHNHYVNSVAFSANRVHLASASYDGIVKIWDSTMGQCLHTLRGHSNSVHSVAFSIDGMQLASASYDSIVNVWDSTTGQCLQRLDIGHSLHEFFFAQSGAQLCTEIGALKLETRAGSTMTSLPVTGTVETPSCYCFKVDADGTWIERDDVNLLRLPPEYRPGKVAVAGCTLAIGCASGRVLIFRFSRGELAV
ncbi:WD40 domain-containing protein [Colletotrichum incanum]|nr:WD40 domain-containing protein [Colletotrichum incanum]